MIPVTHPAILSAVERFFRQPDVNGNLRFLSGRLPGSAEFYVAGGAIRNILMDLFHGNAPFTKDIDTFIGGLNRNFSLSTALHEQTVHAADLKGIRWYPAASLFYFDLCLIPDFIVIETFHLDPIMENLLASIDFTMNAILYDFKQKVLVESGCTNAVRNRMIDFNCRHIVDHKLMAYRILLMQHKTGFTLSEPVFHYVKNRLDLETVRLLKKLFKEKLGKTLGTILMDRYDDLCKYASYDAYRADQNRAF